jgi:hypothetical protein
MNRFFLEDFCLSIVNLIDFSNLLENFTKFLISQNWNERPLFLNSVIFGAEYGHLATNEKGCESSRGRLVKKTTKLPYFKEKKVNIARYRP